MIRKISMSFMAVAIVTACASSPDKMSAADVSPLKYRKYDCEQIEQEADRVSKKVTRLYQQLKSEATADKWQLGVGLVLLWPTLFFLEGGDGPEAVEYRQLKGEYDALRITSIDKKCSLELKGITPKAKPKPQPVSGFLE